MQETQETWVQSLSQEDPLEQEMATHSCIFTWKIPQTEEPSRLQSKEFQRVGHDLAYTCAHTHTHTHTILKIKLNHFVVHQKLTQHCKSTILQFLKKERSSFP